jgi:hypothetical protein
MNTTRVSVFSGYDSMASIYDLEQKVGLLLLTAIYQ